MCAYMSMSLQVLTKIRKTSVLCVVRILKSSILWTHLLSHLAHTLDTGAVQVAVVLARLDEPMALDVLLHLFPR